MVDETCLFGLENSGSEVRGWTRVLRLKGSELGSDKRWAQNWARGSASKAQGSKARRLENNHTLHKQFYSNEL